MSKGAAAISIIMALVLGFVVGNITGSRTPAEPGGEATEAAGDTNTGPNQADAERIPVGHSPVLGPNTALVTIVEFSDFQCPFCSRVEDTMHQIRQQYGNDVRIVWKNAPLPFHNNATPAAEAAAEAFAQGGNAKFWQMHDLLYQHQNELDRQHLETYAQQLGLNMARFRASLDGHTHQADVDADKNLAQQVGAQGTPNFFINGSHIVGAQPFDRFKTLIDQILARARTITPRNRVYAQMVASPVQGPDDSPSPAPGGNQPSPQQPQAPQPPQRQEDPNAVYRVPVGHSPVRGHNDALVTMVVFSDFQCPFCGRVETTLNTLAQRYGNDLRIVWKNEPLPFHDKARPAAEAAMEAYAQGGSEKFWRMHDVLFQHQGESDGLDRAHLEQYAEQIGLNMARFRAAMDGHTHQAEIDADHQLAQQIEANGTPHFFINGRRLIGAQPEERFTQAIDEAKRRAEEAIRTVPGTTRANVYERLIASGATAMVYLPGGAAPAPAPQNAPPGDDENRVYTVRPNPRAPFFGNPNARVVIEHFSDFQCPFCSRVGPQVDQIRQRYGDRVKFVWRNYPLPFHNNAMPAAEAAMEAFAQRGTQGFWAFHDLLFQHQQEIDRPHLEQYAEQSHLDMARFRAALDNHTHQAEIEADRQAADATGAQIGTPAFFIGGHFVAGALPFEEFQRRIDAALAAAPGGAAAHPAAAH
jgi:protein-disulfide isomerase